MRRGLFVITTVAILGGVACLQSLDGFTGGPSDGGVPDQVAPDAPPSASDAGADSADGSCPGTGGPTMVRIPMPDGTSYCIDRTEVTNVQYTAFLNDAANLDRSKLPALCTSHGPFVPADSNGVATFPYPAGQDNYPVGNVDWCDAHAFCIWAGKRLCGRIGGGSNPQSDSTNPNASQWYRACSLNGTRFYPYGDTYDAGVCNSRDHNADGTLSLVDVGSLPGCEGGYPGLFDMSGNVEEMEDSCDADGGCNSRGGSFVDNGPATVNRCDDLEETVHQGHGSGDIGFRCCGP